MKLALILEKDRISREKTSQLLRWLGYLPAPVRTPDEALNVASAISFDVIVTCTAEKPNERRSLTGELKRSAPEAAIVLITDGEDESAGTRHGYYAGVSAVIRRPATVDALRRVVQFGIDGFGLQPLCVPYGEERRRKLV